MNGKRTGRPPVDENIRFWRNVERTDTCWLWTGPLCKGYGSFKRAGRKTISAHKFAYLTCVGNVAGGLLVCHRCDVPKCVRPSHLFLGTAADNNADCMQKGRWRAPKPDGRKLSAAQRRKRAEAPEVFARGERVHTAKLSADQVLEIQTLRRQGWKYRELAARFGVSLATAAKAATGKSWAHLYNEK